MRLQEVVRLNPKINYLFCFVHLNLFFLNRKTFFLLNGILFIFIL